MDLKTGGDLRYYLRKKAVFEEKDVAFYVSCISAALNHIHSHNIIHRDVKPGAIIRLYIYWFIQYSNVKTVADDREHHPG